MKVQHRILALLLLSCFLNYKLINAQDEDDDDDDFGVEDDFDDAPDSFDEMDEDEPTLSVPKAERLEFVEPKLAGDAHFSDAFLSSEEFFKKWVKSEAKKDGADDDISKYDGQWSIEETTDNPLINDLYLVLKSKAKHHAVAAKLAKPFKFEGKPFIVQYEVKFQNGQECGGAYVKLLSADAKLNLKSLHDKTPYTIMFGPDKCGNDDKLHFIFRHKNPKTGEFEEKHANKPTASFGEVFTDKKTHLYTLIVNPDNTFEVLVDQNTVNSGSLLEDVHPAVNPPLEIEDKDDKKPEEWDERERIVDPDATKPEDWDEDAPEYIEDEDATMPDGWLEDEEELIADPDADKPQDWDDEIDGEWEAPLISNPLCESAPGCGKWSRPQIKNPGYKGKWKAPKIDNPNYKGKWKPRMIPNPDYFEDLTPYKMTAIGAVGLELWSMSDGIAFDNLLITDNRHTADQWAKDTWHLKRDWELAGQSGSSVVDSVLEMTNEKPWIWAVILVVVLLPLVIIITFCCSSSPSKPDAAAERKKTDARTADDDAAAADGGEPESSSDDAKDDADADAAASGDAPAAAAKKSPRKGKKASSKSDLDAPAAAANDDADVMPPEVDFDRMPSFDTDGSSSSDDYEQLGVPTGAEPAEADAEDDEAEEEAAPVTRSSPRKRQTRSRKE